MQQAILFIRFKNYLSKRGWFDSKDLSQIVPVEMDIPWKQRATFSPWEIFVKSLGAIEAGQISIFHHRFGGGGFIY